MRHFRQWCRCRGLQINGGGAIHRISMRKICAAGSVIDLVRDQPSTNQITTDISTKPQTTCGWTRATEAFTFVVLTAQLFRKSRFCNWTGVHHAVSSGGELTVTNSNSNFGGVCALADGFVDYSFDTDKNWNVGFIKVAENIEAGRFQITFLAQLSIAKAMERQTFHLRQS